MKKDEGFHEYVMNEVFKEFPEITSRSMFGGWGIYNEGVFFALIADGELYFKVDEALVKKFISKGSKQFVYFMPNGRETKMNYWELPTDLYENSEELGSWIEKSVEVAKKAKRK